jgi:RNA polymerase sigma factor (sigma-70 family)
MDLNKINKLMKSNLSKDKRELNIVISSGQQLIHIAKGVLVYYLPNNPNHKDAIQDSFESLFKLINKGKLNGGKSFSNADNLKGYLVDVGKSKANDILKKDKFLTDFYNEIKQPLIVDSFATNQNSNIKSKLLSKEIENLPPKEKKVIKNCLEGLKYQAIADEMGCEYNSVKGAFYRGKNRLIKALRKAVNIKSSNNKTAR